MLSSIHNRIIHTRTQWSFLMSASNAGDDFHFSLLLFMSEFHVSSVSIKKSDFLVKYSVKNANIIVVDVVIARYFPLENHTRWEKYVFLFYDDVVFSPARYNANVKSHLLSYLLALLSIHDESRKKVPSVEGLTRKWATLHLKEKYNLYATFWDAPIDHVIWFG